MRPGLSIGQSKLHPMRAILPLFALALVVAAPSFARPAAAPPRGDALLAGFRTPPPTAKPRVWWHWMNGNVTERGIRLDIDWMRRIGIGGMDCIDASIDTPQVVKQRLVYMSPGWKKAFRFAAGLAAKYGMELGIDSSPGWSMTGGPWVTPQDAMKKMVWSTTEVEGGKPFHGTLPQPPDTIGPIQNAKFSGDITPTPQAAALRFYRDSIAIAYRAPVEEPVVTEATSNLGPIDKATLSDGDLRHGIALKAAGLDGEVWVRLVFDKPAQIQGLTLGLTLTKGLGYAAEVEASDDGNAWRPVARMPAAAQLQRMVLVEQTMSFPPATGRYFRVVLRPAPPLPTSLRPRVFAPGAVNPAPPPEPTERLYTLYELMFHARATVNEFEKKAQFAAPPRDFYTIASSPDFAPGTAIDPKSVVVLSDRMRPDGSLDWTPPPGHWVVLRIGYSLTGAENHPATPEATGLEVDKLNAAHVRAYLKHYLDTYEAVTGPALFGRRGLQSLFVDSSEIGEQNWTEDILAAFKRLNGYDPAPWLPALTGAAVESLAASDKFLWDFRRTIEELFARNHYGEIDAVARQRGLFDYAESIEDHRPTFGDDMTMRQYAAIPMGAMWTYGEKYPSALTYEADILGAASVAHVYGWPLAAAESLTSAGQPWAYAPRELKPFIDMEFVRGVNRVVLHTSVHQPVDRPPGLSLFGYGQFFNRLESWANLAGPWVTYMARASYLLQQGRFAADVAYFYGEEAPITSLFGNQRVDDVPEGYGFDFVDPDALAHELSVADGELVTRSGMHYRVLYLGGSSRMMTVGVLHRIAELARAGAIVVGRRPEASPSLIDTRAAFEAAADDLFGPAGTTAQRSYGAGKVFPSGSLAEAFAALKVEPDFAYTGTDAKLLYIHRRLEQGDVYFISNREDRPVSASATFRVAGMSPELWDAITGESRPAPYRITDGRTEVPLSLPPYSSVFVVFRMQAQASAQVIPEPSVSTLETLKGPWTLSFQPHRGAPPKITLTTLESWSDSEISGVRHFSGTGTYTKTFLIRRGAVNSGTHLILDLGDVRELAQVSLNGKVLGIVWTPPFQFDITKAARPGPNLLTIKVTNLWVNRLIGDAQPGIRKSYTFTVIPTYRPEAPLRVSGLIGPVLIRKLTTPNRP